MRATEVAPGVYRLSATAGPEILFESIWPLPFGVSMNSFLVKGEHCAIIDGVCGWDGVPETLIAQLDELSVDLKDIRYVILNHLEPDHSAWLVPFSKLTDRFQLCASAKGIEMARAFYGPREQVRELRSGDRIDLGAGRELVFEEIPNVHWPETIATYEPSNGILFSCDLFSSFGSIADKPYDDQLTADQLGLFEEETLRYYSNILGTVSASVDRAIRRLQGLDVRIVAPAHGPVWRKDPRRIVELYRRYARYLRGPAEAAVTLIWSSMYGMTELAVEAVCEGIRSQGVPLFVHRVPQTHISHILASAWRSSGIVIGAPTYEYKMFPPMAAVLDELGRKRVMNRKGLYFGSFGWSGGAQRELHEIIERLRMRWEMAEPVQFNGAPGEQELRILRERAAELARAVKLWQAQPESAA